MDDGIVNVKVFTDHFEASSPTGNSLHERDSPVSGTGTDYSMRSPRRVWVQRKLMGAASILNLFSVSGRSWSSANDCHEKAEVTALEMESLRSEIADLEEKEGHLKARLEHIDEILRSARLSGYLHIRTRWAALPGEPPLDDTDVDDWLPRFVVLHGSCIYFYLTSTELSPQDSTLLSDVTEVGPLPSIIQEDGQTRYLFYVLTRLGLRFECWSHSQIQVDLWLKALVIDCKLVPDSTDSKSSES